MAKDTRITEVPIRECPMCGARLRASDATIFVVHDEKDIHPSFPGTWKAVCCSQACAVAWREIDEIERST